MMNVAFVEPKCGFNGYNIKLPIMGVSYLSTILRNKGCNVKVYSEDFMRVYNPVTRRVAPELLRADTVCISSMTATAPKAYKIAAAVRKQNPKARIVIGGIHPSFMASESMQYADCVVKGEGERVIEDVVGDPKRNGVVQGVPTEDLNELPIPEFSLIERVKMPFKLAPVMTSRGCPFDCTFCSVTTMFGRKYRFRSPDLVVEELKKRKSEGHRKVFFYDDNFAADKARTREIAEKIMAARLNMTWTAQVRADVARDEELVRLMRRSGCLTLLVGFESINQRTLEAYNKKLNVEDIKRCIKTLNAAGIDVHGMFVLGSDEDDIETIMETARFGRRMGMYSAQFSVLFPIPGTRLYDQMEREERIFLRDWSLYDGSHVVFTPMKMTALELQLAILKAWKKFYSIKHFLQFAYSRYLLSKWHKQNKSFIAKLKDSVHAAQLFVDRAAKD